MDDEHTSLPRLALQWELPFLAFDEVQRQLQTQPGTRRARRAGGRAAKVGLEDSPGLGRGCTRIGIVDADLQFLTAVTLGRDRFDLYPTARLSIL